MDTQTRIGIGAAAVLGIIQLLEPHMSLEWRVPIYLILGTIAIWGFLPIFRIILLSGWPFIIGYVPLPKATANLFGKTRNTDIAEFAERSSDTPESIRNWYAYWMHLHGVPIYGKKPPSPIYELIPADEIAKSEHFDGGAKRLISGIPSRVSFDDLAVRRTDLFKFRKLLLGKRDEDAAR